MQAQVHLIESRQIALCACVKYLDCRDAHRSRDGIERRTEAPAELHKIKNTCSFKAMNTKACGVAFQSAWMSASGAGNFHALRDGKGLRYGCA